MNYTLRFLLMALCVGVMLSSGSIPAEAQTYEVSVLNQATLDGGIFQFDLYVTRTGATSWRMGDASFQLTYNSSAFTNRVISYVLGSSQLAAGYTIAPSINTTRIDIEIQSPSTYASSTEITTTRIGTFRVSTIINSSANMNLAWRTALGDWQVMLERLSDDNMNDITDPSPTTYIAPDNTPLPIQMASFTASVVRDNDVEVTWKTVSETSNYGFEVYRRRGETGDWTKIAFVEGHGTTLTPQSYSHVDRGVTFGKYSYQIKQIDLDGKSKPFPEVDVTVGVTPGKFILAQNYPNPFNPSTTIEFAVPQNGVATMKLYNVLGQEVATIFEGKAETGEICTAQFNASNLGSGVYFYRLTAGSFVETKKMLLLR